MGEIQLWIRTELPVYLDYSKQGGSIELIVAHPKDYEAIKSAGPYPDSWIFEWSETVGKPLVFEDKKNYYGSRAMAGD